MINPDKLNKLFALASGKKVKPEQKEVKKKSFKKDIGKYKGIYSDPLDAWSNWYRDSKKKISPDMSEDHWNEAEANFPGSPDQAKNWLRTDFNSAIESTNPATKEINMRNQMSRSPNWLAEEQLPALATNAMAVSNQNQTKAGVIYKKSIEDRLLQKDLSQLDPEIPADVHTQDALKLETLGLFDASRIVNGRFSSVSNNGSIQPAFSLEIDQDIPEAAEIQTIAEPIFSSAISRALNDSSTLLDANNRASTGAMVNGLQSGNMEIDEWENALSMMNGDRDSVADAGIQGLVKKNPGMNYQDMISNAIDIHDFKKGIK